MCEFHVFGHEPEIPARPFSFELAEHLFVCVEDRKGAANGKELLFERTNKLVVFVEDFDFREKERKSTLYADDLFPECVANFDVKGRHCFVFGKSKHLGKETERILTAFHYEISRLWVKNVVVVGGFKHADMFFYDIDVIF